MIRFTINFLIIQPTGSQSLNKEKAEDKENILEYTSSKYGLDESLINGLIYLSENPNAKEDQFFISEDYLSGTIYIGGQTFEKLSLKYELIYRNGFSFLIQYYKEFRNDYN